MQKKKFLIQKVVVLGSGVMGSQIAAHCVNTGLDVWLLDLKSENPEEPNHTVVQNIRKLENMNPAPLGLPSYSERIKPGNFEDDMHLVSQADWVCEAVVERMDIKKKMISKIEEHWQPGTIVSSNTSGLPISRISEDNSQELQQHFLGTHFFNPPRYMKLLEIIPTKQTSQAVTTYMTRFSEKILGKGVVHCNDTPNFIANRIGVFSMASIMPWFFEGSFRAEEIDLITGKLTGYSKAATFRTADMAGLDVLTHVAENLYPSVPEDERREIFKLPDGFAKMVDNGWFGNKAGQGFYKKVKTDKGSQYLALIPENMDYKPQKEVTYESISEANKKYKSPEERLRYLVNQDDKVGEFLWKIHCDLLLYSANRVPEITGSIEAIDRAMRWGFNWELGPFQRWDAIGVKESVGRMEKDGLTIPGSVKSMIESGRNNFYEDGTVYNLTAGEVEELCPPASDAITVAILTDDGQEAWSNEHAGLYNMGDGVALLEFRTKQQTLGFDLVNSVGTVCEKVRESFNALVIGHDQENFSYGANLVEAVNAIKTGEKETIRRAAENFQSVATGLRYQPFPVVAAVSGRAFGGAVEFMLHCDKVVAHHELYCGLIELGVGLIPAGGGTKEMLLRTMKRVLRDDNVDPVPFLKDSFKTIGMGKVSDGAPKARELGFLRENDEIVMHRDLLLKSAKEHAMRIASDGYRPPVEPRIRLLGKTGYSALRLMLFIMKESGYISPYDEVLAEKVAYVMTGGDLSEPQDVPESYVLKLEREVILELFEDERTFARMQHMLEKGKPLRN